MVTPCASLEQEGACVRIVKPAQPKGPSRQVFQVLCSKTLKGPPGSDNHQAGRVMPSGPYQAPKCPLKAGLTWYRQQGTSHRISPLYWSLIKHLPTKMPIWFGWLWKLPLLWQSWENRTLRQQATLHTLMARGVWGDLVTDSRLSAQGDTLEAKRLR